MPSIPRIGQIAIAATLVLASFIATAGASPTEHDEVTVAVLDSGIRPTHETFEPGQVVAWEDFVNGRPSPYDDQGHGTAVASMVGGTETFDQTPSHAPGVDLAIGKVLSANNGVAWSDLEAAIYWAVDDVDADVITISVYSYIVRPSVPVVGGWSTYEDRLFDAIEHAWDHGVFVSILAGNGYQNAGIPTMSYLHPPATSPHALIVGGADSNRLPVSPLGSMEPEVTAPYYVNVAQPDCDRCYRPWQGTSFSTPLVAGMAAHLLEHAADHGESIAPEQMEELLTHAAEDTPAPPTLEGFGFLGSDGLERAESALSSGGQPDQGPTGPVNDLYVDNVQRTQRQTWYEANGG